MQMFNSCPQIHLKLRKFSKVYKLSLQLHFITLRNSLLAQQSNTFPWIISKPINFEIYFMVNILIFCVSTVRYLRMTVLNRD